MGKRDEGEIKIPEFTARKCAVFITIFLINLFLPKFWLLWIVSSSENPGYTHKLNYTKTKTKNKCEAKRRILGNIAQASIDFSLVPSRFFLSPIFLSSSASLIRDPISFSSRFDWFCSSFVRSDSCLWLYMYIYIYFFILFFFPFRSVFPFW